MIIVVKKTKHQRFLNGVDPDELCLHPCWVVCALLVLSSREFLAIIDADADVGIRRACANLIDLKPAISLNNDLNDTNSCIKGYTRKKLLEKNVKAGLLCIGRRLLAVLATRCLVQNAENSEDVGEGVDVCNAYWGMLSMRTEGW